jgi:hypothetical protein
VTTPYLPQTMSDIVVDLSPSEALVDFAKLKASGPAARTGIPMLAQPNSLIIARML